MLKRWTRSCGIAWEELDNEALVVSPKTRTSWRLSPTATFIWKHCNGSTGLRELAEVLSRKSGGGIRKIESELLAFCRTLEQAGLLKSEMQPAMIASSVAGFTGLYAVPSMVSRSLDGGPRRRPSPRGNSGPG